MALDMNVALKINAGVTGQQAVDQLRTSMQRLGDGASGVAGKFTALKGAVGALAGAAVVAGVTSMIKSVIEAGDKLNDLRQKTGITVEDLDALGYAAELNGSSLDQVSGALGKLSKNMAEAAGGSKEATAVFRQFGISQQDLKSGAVTTTEAMARIADKLAAMPDGWQKTAAAQQVFGKSAADLIPLLNAGGGAIRDARQELESMGALMTGDLATQADEFNDNMSRLRRMASALGISLAKDLLPVLNGFTSGIVQARLNSDKLSGDTSLQMWAEATGLAIAAMVDVVRVAGQAFYALLGSGRAVLADIGALSAIIFKGPAALFSDQAQAELQAALNNRNLIVQDANQRFVDLWEMDGSKFFNAVKGAMDKAKTATAGTPGRPGGSSFDFGAGKESEFAKLKAQLTELAAKTGDVTKAQEILGLLRTEKYKDLTNQQRNELLGIAATIDAKKSQADTEKELKDATDAASKARDSQYERESYQISDFKTKQQEKLELLLLEGQRINMTAVEYERRAQAIQHEYDVSRTVKDMLPETAAQYRAVADATFAAQQAVTQLNYEQSRTFGAGAQAALSSYIEDISNVAKSTENAMTSAFQGMEDALVDFAMTGKLNFKDLANSIIKDMLRIAIQQMILRPILGAMFPGSSVIPMQPGGGYANGGAFGSYGEISAFANGGIVNKPTMFAFANGGAGQLGLMGEAGPEAIMPLQRGSDGKLGVRAAGGGEVNNVTVNVNVESGSTDQTATASGAAQLGKAIASAIRVELMNQKRPGGLLAA